MNYSIVSINAEIEKKITKDTHNFEYERNII